MYTFFKGIQRTQTVEGWTLLHIYPMSDGILVPCKVVLSFGKCQDFCKHHRANDRNRTTIQIGSTCEQSKTQFINSPTPNLGFLSVSPRKEEGSEGRRENFSQTHWPVPHSSILINNHKSPDTQEKAAVWENLRHLSCTSGENKNKEMKWKPPKETREMSQDFSSIK